MLSETRQRVSARKLASNIMAPVPAVCILSYPLLHIAPWPWHLALCGLAAGATGLLNMLKRAEPSDRVIRLSDARAEGVARGGALIAVAGVAIGYNNSHIAASLVISILAISIVALSFLIASACLYDSTAPERISSYQEVFGDMPQDEIHSTAYEPHAAGLVNNNALLSIDGMPAFGLLLWGALSIAGSRIHAQDVGRFGEFIGGLFVAIGGARLITEPADRFVQRDAARRRRVSRVGHIAGGTVIDHLRSSRKNGVFFAILGAAMTILSVVR